MGPILCCCLRFLFWILIGLLDRDLIGMLGDWCCLCSSDKWHILCHVFLYTRPFSLTSLPDGPDMMSPPSFSIKANRANSNRWSPSKAELPSKSGLSSSPNCLCKRHMLYLKPVGCFCSLSIRFGIGCEFCGWLATDRMFLPVLTKIFVFWQKYLLNLVNILSQFHF